MKLYICLSLLLTVVAVSMAGEDKQMRMLKKWAFAKAIGQCIGEKNMKMWMIKKKEAYRKCSGMEVPELDLPMFQSPYRVASGVVSNAFGSHQQQNAFSADQWIENAMKKFFFKKMLKEMMENEFDMDDDDEDDEMMPGGPMRFFKASRRRNRHRYRREGDKSEIIEKLADKLEYEEMKMKAEIGNMTCMMRECGVIDASNNLTPVDEMIKEKEKFEIEDPWLKDELIKSLKHCHAFASAVPQDMLEDCEYGKEYAYIGRVKFFKMCMKISKAKTCMMKDIKDKVNENFGPVEGLAEDLGFENVKQFLPVMHKILYGKMMED